MHTAETLLGLFPEADDQAWLYDVAEGVDGSVTVYSMRAGDSSTFRVVHSDPPVMRRAVNKIKWWVVGWNARRERCPDTWT